MTLDEWAQVMATKVLETTTTIPNNNFKMIAHFRPMHAYIFGQNTTTTTTTTTIQSNTTTNASSLILAPHRLFCQEQFNHAVDWINDSFGDNNGEPLLQIQGHKHHTLQSHHDECPSLSIETRAFIEEHYALDYCIFGYDTSSYNSGNDGQQEDGVPSLLVNHNNNNNNNNNNETECKVEHLDKDQLIELYLSCKEQLGLE